MIDTLPKGGTGGVDAVHDNPVAPMGECFFDNETNTYYIYGRADVNLVQGEIVMPKRIALVENGLAAGGAPAGGHTLTDANGAFNTALTRVPGSADKDGSKWRQHAIIVITAGTGKGQRGTIIRHTNTVLTVYWHGQTNGTLGTALDTTSDYQIIIPWLFVKSQTGEGAAGAVQQATLNQGKYGWLVQEGDAWMLAGTAVTSGAQLVIDGTDGRVAPAGNNDSQTIGQADTAAADGDLVFGNFKANIRTKKVPDTGKTVDYTPSYSHPAAA